MRSLRAGRSLVFLLLYSQLRLVTAQNTRQCFFPNGGLAAADVPCGPNQDNCCGPGALCLSNRLCFDPVNHIFSRGSCADQTWQSGTCQSFCRNFNPSGGDAIDSCGVNGYCCREDTHCDCTTGNGTFQLQAGNPVTTIGVVGPTTIVVTSLPTSSQPTTSTTASLTSTTSSTTATSSQSGASGTNKVAVGVGVGLGGFIALAAIGLGLYFWKRRQNRTANVYTHQGNQENQGYQGYHGHQSYQENQGQFYQETEGPKPYLPGSDIGQGSHFGSATQSPPAPYPQQHTEPMQHFAGHMPMAELEARQG